MILVYDGPIIWILLVAVVLYFGYRKEKKESDKIQNDIDKIRANRNDFKRLGEVIHNGIKTIKKDDFKNCYEKDFKFYSDLYGVKFI